MLDASVCVSFQHIINSGSKQTSFRITIMEMYATLDKAKHNTSHLIMAAIMWLRCRCGNSWHIWPTPTKFGVNRQIAIKPDCQILREFVQCKPLWYVLTEGQTAMMKVVDFFAVCTNVTKDAVHKQSHGSWIHAIWLHLFSNLQSLSGPWHTLDDLTNSRKTVCPVYEILCCGLLCDTGNRALRHLLLAGVQTVTVIHSVRLLFTAVQIKMANCLCWFN